MKQVLPTTETAARPQVTVAIPTRNRPDDLRRCLESLSAIEYPAWNILLVDQSDDHRTKQLAGHFGSRLPGLRYCRMGEMGLSRARNHAMRMCSSEILAFLDDDCTVEPDWLHWVAQAFSRHPEAAVVFGLVQAIPHDPGAAFIPTSLITRERVFRGRLALLHLHRAGAAARIMGAGMYLRRAAVTQVGPFDVHLGPGARFGIADDREYTYRVLRSGRAIVMTPTIKVLHYGVRSYHDGSAARMFRTVAYAGGAVDMKLLRCGEWPALLMIPVHAWRFLCFIRPGNLIRRRGATGLAWIVWYVRGLLDSFRVRVDRRRLLYMPQPTAASIIEGE